MIPSKIIGIDLQTKIRESKILVVGAGGIGCELLKNLIACGFIDLDTIDISNLNRQFLFQQKHTAKEVMMKRNPNLNIESDHANIKDKCYDIAFFSGFHIVMNALDNLDARRHVNRKCLAANVPLIESGTSGFFGQGLTECFECIPKPIPKTFPVCTIRITPSQPIHCIVWAKSFLFNLLFGVDEDNVDIDITENESNAKEIDELKENTKILKNIKDSINSEDFDKLVFDKVFGTDIQMAASNKETWGDKTPPSPLWFYELDAKASTPLNDDAERIWDLYENFHIYKQTIKELAVDFIKNGDLSFDKDDLISLKFVSACSNIRSHIYNIPMLSVFKIKEIAGNIIPANATTNAIIAGLIVNNAYKILLGQIEKCKNIFLVQGFIDSKLLNDECIQPPKFDCAVCGANFASLNTDIQNTTINDLIDCIREGIYRAKMETEKLEPVDENSLSISHGDRMLFDPDFLDNINRPLSSLGIGINECLFVDFDCNLRPLNIIISPLKDTNRLLKVELPLLYKSGFAPEQHSSHIPEPNTSTDLQEDLTIKRIKLDYGIDEDNPISL